MDCVRLVHVNTGKCKMWIAYEKIYCVITMMIRVTSKLPCKTVNNMMQLKIIPVSLGTAGKDEVNVGSLRYVHKYLS